MFWIKTYHLSQSHHHQLHYFLCQLLCSHHLCLVCSRDMIFTFHCSCMEYFHILSPKNLTLSHFVGVHEPLNNATEIYTLTPMRWNPHMDAYAQNEDSIIDWEGNIKDNDKSNRDIKIVPENVGDEYQNEYKVSSVEVKCVDEILKARTQQDNNNNWYWAHELSAISSVLCPHLLTLMIEEWLNLRSDAVNIGAMNGYDDKYLDKYDDALFDDITLTTKDTIEDAVKELGDEEDMDDFFASSVHGGSKVGIDAKHLSKEWLISYEDAKQTIDATTQHGTPLPNPAMNQNYTTND